MSLFDSFTLRGITIPNRVAISPMSQYAATDGLAGDWHFVHLGRFALGGAGLVFTEATAVEQRGRRTPGDLGLWRDDQIAPLGRIAEFLRSQGSVPGIQLAHAGRKASERRPWHNESPLNEEDRALRGEAPWQTIGPTDEPYAAGWHTPAAMSEDDISAVIEAFRHAAGRALEAGFEIIEVYAAHGFLLHQFYSPASNRRTDRYGGDFDGRVRLAVEVAAAIRTVWPEHLPLSFRLSAKDWIDGGWEVADTIELARRLKAEGVDLIDCSSGGLGGSAKPQRMPLAQGFQVPFAEAVRREADIATMAVGFLWDPRKAEAIVSEGKADLVALAREVLNDPNWALHAARTLGHDVDFGVWKPAFGWWLHRRERVIEKLGLRDRG